MTSCGGEVVTYRANIDMRLSIQVLWDEESEKMSIKIKPVETDIYDVNVDVTFASYFFGDCFRHLIFYRVANHRGSYFGSKGIKSYLTMASKKVSKTTPTITRNKRKCLKCSVRSIMCLCTTESPT